MSNAEDLPTRPKQERARQTRRRMIEAAYGLFCERGYGVPLTEVAAVAGVSVQNVYLGFQNKRQLAREALQLAVHGPDLDLPPHEQPWFEQLVKSTDAREAIRIWVENTLPVYRRVAPLAGMFIAEPELSDTWERSEKLRMFGFRQAMTAVAPKGKFRQRYDVDAAVQVMFVLLSPLVYQEFVGRLGWSTDRWGDWVAELLADTIFA
jgi:AcrR family transcriptional regulator